jgi:3'(2'), 5'-bisphosphate nucleotidase
MLKIDSSLIENLREIALEAGSAILKHYKTSINVARKDDESPLTQADLDAHNIIESGLNQISNFIPKISEEGTNRDAKEKTVNIALINVDRPVLGVVYAPALEKLYFSDQNFSAFLQDSSGVARKISVRKPSIEGMDIVASKSHSNKETEEFISKLKVRNLVNTGSSLKFCLVAEGKADCYPRLGPTMEWDTAAAHAVLLAAGGRVENMDGSPLSYGKPQFRNPDFIAWGG